VNADIIAAMRGNQANKDKEAQFEKERKAMAER
jgi:hypothetical protein